MSIVILSQAQKWHKCSFSGKKTLEHCHDDCDTLWCRFFISQFTLHWGQHRQQIVLACHQLFHMLPTVRELIQKDEVLQGNTQKVFLQTSSFSSRILFKASCAWTCFLMRISASKWANRFVVEITLLKCSNMLSSGPTPGSFDIIGFTNRLLQVWKHDWKVFFKCFNAKMNWMLTNRN